MSVAWAVGAWGNNTWLGMNAGPPNAWRGASTPVAIPTPTGGKGDNEAKRTTYKPTGLLGRRKKVPEGRKDVEERVDQAREIEAEVAGQLARERGEPVPELLPPVSEMSAAEIDAEIRVLLQKRMRSEEDEMMLLMLMIAAAG